MHTEMSTATEPRNHPPGLLFESNEPAPAPVAPFRLKASRTEPLTRELAAWLAALPSAPVERAIAPRRLKHLEKKAKQKLLVTFNWATVECDGRVTRINGQHSSRMLSGLNGEFPAGLFAHIDEYAVEDEGQMAELFRQFDDRASSRSPADVAGAYQGLVENLRGLDRPMAKLGVEGIVWFWRRVPGLPMAAADDQYVVFADVRIHPFLLSLPGIITTKCPELRNMYVIAAMWGTHEASASGAAMFWELVAAGGEPGNDSHPANRLDEWLRQLRAAKEDKPAGSQIYQACINCWNAFRRGKDIERVRFDTKKGLAEPLA